MDLATYVVLGLVLAVQNYNTPFVNAAPQTPTEACPPDSVLSGDECKCLPEKCPEKPPCPWNLELADNSTATPGSCCPSYRCVGCPESNDLEEECPCAEGAKMDETGTRCVCEDEEKHLVNGECVCNPASCELPPLCDKKSVAVTSQEGCCRKTICKQCPLDSESTNKEVEEIEDHCVCLPCEQRQCGPNEKAVIKKKGNSFPGNCCDLYECEKTEEDTDVGCLVGDILYKNGDQWDTPDMQLCKCTSGLSLCTAPKDVAQNCYVDNKMYKHLEIWTAEDGCLQCTCFNGNERCVSHFCYSNKESKIHENYETKTCLRNEISYQHLESWLEKDGCTNCTCFNGTANCSEDLCEQPIEKINPWIYITIAVITFAFVSIGMAVMCVYRSKRKSSIDLTQCQYESVNNNNTIKKTDQLL